ncbi:adhesion G protein-coupled receptor B1-like [Xenentodon cancila]
MAARHWLRDRTDRKGNESETIGLVRLRGRELDPAKAGDHSPTCEIVPFLQLGVMTNTFPVPGPARWPFAALLFYFAPLLLMRSWCHGAPSGPESDSCSTLVQSRFFGFFLSSSVFPAVPCSWTLQNPDPRRYTIFIKVTKPTEGCVPSQLRTFQYDSFLETTRTYLGMEGFDEVVRLCDAATPVAFLEAGKQFLQVRKGPPRAGAAITGGDGEFKTEYLVVGKRNPSMAACQMLCQWLEDCLASSTSSRPCGIMQTPCLCWDPPPQLSQGDGCYHNGVYLENCLPSVKDTAKEVELSGLQKTKLCAQEELTISRCADVLLADLEYSGGRRRILSVVPSGGRVSHVSTRMCLCEVIGAEVLREETQSVTVNTIALFCAATETQIPQKLPSKPG